MRFVLAKERMQEKKQTPTSTQQRQPEDTNTSDQGGRYLFIRVLLSPELPFRLYRRGECPKIAAAGRKEGLRRTIAVAGRSHINIDTTANVNSSCRDDDRGEAGKRKKRKKRKKTKKQKKNSRAVRVNTSTVASTVAGVAECVCTGVFEQVSVA